MVILVFCFLLICLTIKGIVYNITLESKKNTSGYKIVDVTLAERSLRQAPQEYRVIKLISATTPSFLCGKQRSKSGGRVMIPKVCKSDKSIIKLIKRKDLFGLLFCIIKRQ